MWAQGEWWRKTKTFPLKSMANEESTEKYLMNINEDFRAAFSSNFLLSEPGKKKAEENLKNDLNFRNIFNFWWKVCSGNGNEIVSC